MDTDFDVVVIGGGAGGLNAALVLGRARRRVAVIDGGRPRNAPASHLHGFLTRDGTPPADLLAHGRREVADYGVRLVEADVNDVDRPGIGFRIHMANRPPVTAHGLLFATGLTDQLPDVAGLRSRWGHDVLHCPYCHGYEVADQPLGVLNDGLTAVEEPALIRNWSADVVLFTNGTTLDDAGRARLMALDVE